MQLRYLLTNTAGSPLKIQAVTLVPTQASSHGVIDNIATIDLAGVAPGEYRVSIDLEGDAADAVVLPVGVVETVPRPVLHAEAKAPPNDPDLMMIRAAQFRTVGRFDDAIAALRNVLRRVPDKEEALLLLGEMLQAADRHEELEALLAPRLVRMPRRRRVAVDARRIERSAGQAPRRRPLLRARSPCGPLRYLPAQRAGLGVSRC